MSDGAFHAYIGLLVLSSLILTVLAVRGFGQSTGARVLDGLFGAGFLGYAAYLLIGDPETVRVFFYAFAAPVVALVHAVRSAGEAKARRGAAGFTPAPYAPQPAAVPAQPFPAPPPPPAAVPARPFPVPPLPPAAVPAAAEPPAVAPPAHHPLPSGLTHRAAEQPGRHVPAPGPAGSGVPRSGLTAAPGASPEELASRFPARPSGLPADASVAAGSPVRPAAAPFSRPPAPGFWAAPSSAAAPPTPQRDARPTASPAPAAPTGTPAPITRQQPTPIVRQQPTPNGRHRAEADDAPAGHLPAGVGPAAFGDHRSGTGRSNPAPLAGPSRNHAEPAAFRRDWAGLDAARPGAAVPPADAAFPPPAALPPAAFPPPAPAGRRGRHARGHAEPAPGRHRMRGTEPPAGSPPGHWPPHQR
jgi:hypothetical protein